MLIKIHTFVKGEHEAKGKKNYHSISGIGRGSGKSVGSFGAFLWVLESFQTTFTLRFVSNLESPFTQLGSSNTQLGSPIIQLDSPNIEPASG